MLILKRQRSESVVIAGPMGVERLLKVTLLKIESGNVHLGFEVDSEVLIRRWETLRRTHHASVAEKPVMSAIPR
jgi:sRNA-binding carbon storage regulator CsrA